MNKDNGGAIDRSPVQDRCIVLHPDVQSAREQRRDLTSRLEEAEGLARSIDLQIVDSHAVVIKKPKPATLIGQGVVDRISSSLEADHTEHGDMYERPIVIVDAQLTPVQQRNLERAWDTKVLDRTGLILEIFGDRARTREGRLQVDLAQFSYQLGRLVRSWTHLERQRGGVGFMGGPGETQIETDRRIIRQRIDRLKRDLADVARTRELHRSARRRVPHPIIALVGYTNAGKSTLFNRLTSADVMAEDQLFATLDPTMRTLPLPSGRSAILSDTVGFVSNLPHELVNAFHATLEEVIEADIIVHVRDISHVDTESQKHDVLEVLKTLSDGWESDVPDRPVIEALNKIDCLSQEEYTYVENRTQINIGQAVAISAANGDGCSGLLNLIDELLSKSFLSTTITLDFHEGAALAWLYDRADIEKRRDDENGIVLDIRIGEDDAARFEQTFGKRVKKQEVG